MPLQVPWEQVPDLVAGRRVLLRAGMAYVHKREIGSLVVSHFRARLSKALALTARKWASQLSAEEADRLTPVVEALSVRCGLLIPSTLSSDRRNMLCPIVLPPLDPLKVFGLISRTPSSMASTKEEGDRVTSKRTAGDLPGCGKWLRGNSCKSCRSVVHYFIRCVILQVLGTGLQWR